MATACQLSEDQFLCSICHDVFTEPVTLPCGHNFCKSCVNQHWSADAKCKCPDCKKIFFYRPELKVNVFIAKMAAHFIQSLYRSTRSSKPQAVKQEEVLCDVCTGPKHCASKTCLICLSSYCGSHLMLHLNMCGLKKHQLMEPRGDAKDTVDIKPIEQFFHCVGHVPLMEAEQLRLMLQKTEDDLQDKINTRVKKIDELRSSVRVSNDAVDREISEGVKVFTALKESVQRSLDLLISDITKKKSDTEQQAEGLILELEQEINELEKTGAEVKLLSQADNPLQLFLNSPQLSTEPPTKDWTDIHICPQTHGGAVVRAVSELQQVFSKKTSSLFEAELKRVKTMKVNVTLDTDTSSPPSHTEEEREVPDSANKCNGLVVLGKESFSESFYFEAGVRGRAEWTLGVAKERVIGKGPLMLNPQNGFWNIGLKNKSLYISDNLQMAVFTKFQPDRVGVFVDYKEGVVSFYDVGTSSLIYSFTNVTFDEKLSPFCRIAHVWYGSSAPLISGMNREDFSKYKA